jgi:hypothetical protein
MAEVSLFRLYVLRATYRLVAAGLLFTRPGLFTGLSLPNDAAVIRSLLGAVSVLALLGIRYPLQMLPVLFFEITWKTIWALAFALPLWRADRVDAETAQTARDCVPLVIVFIAIPWRYVFENYIAKRGDRWNNGSAAARVAASGDGRP